MGVKDGDHLIVTTEMKLPFDEISEDDEPLPGMPEPGPGGLLPGIIPDIGYPTANDENTVPV